VSKFCLIALLNGIQLLMEDKVFSAQCIIKSTAQSQHNEEHSHYTHTQSRALWFKEITSPY